MNIRLFSAAFFLILWGSACGSAGDAPSPAGGDSADAAVAVEGSIDPCSLLTQAEASEILGVQAAAGELKAPKNVMGVRFCQWSPADEDQMGLIQISVLQTEAIDEMIRGRGITAEQLFEANKAQIEGLEMVDGIGDDAYWTGSDLTFVKNGVQVSVSAGSAAIVKSGEQGLPAAKKVAVRAAPRI